MIYNKIKSRQFFPKFFDPRFFRKIPWIWGKLSKYDYVSEQSNRNCRDLNSYFYNFPQIQGILTLVQKTSEKIVWIWFCLITAFANTLMMNCSYCVSEWYILCTSMIMNIWIFFTVVHWVISIFWFDMCDIVVICESHMFIWLIIEQDRIYCGSAVSKSVKVSQVDNFFDNFAICRSIAAIKKKSFMQRKKIIFTK